MLDDPELHELVRASSDRIGLWTNLIDILRPSQVVEIGVYRGEFAAHMLRHGRSIDNYYLIDPWRHLDDWNKPANTDDEKFESIYREAKSRTEFAADRRTTLRGKTTEVIDRIADNSLDLAYIDGDHTLRGISIDLHAVYPKVRYGGWIGGDDFSPSIWQHSDGYEPSMVFPFAIYFAEAVSAPICALPFRQFLMEKTSDPHFRLIDLVGSYGDVSLRHQLIRGRRAAGKKRQRARRQKSGRLDDD
jgi:hypothetical protein